MVAKSACVCVLVCLAYYASRLIAAFLYIYRMCVCVCVCSFRGMSFIIIVIGLAFLGLRAFFIDR